MVTGIGERSLAFSRLGVDFAFANFEGAEADFGFELQSGQAFAGGVVLMSRGLTAKFPGTLPHSVSKIHDLSRHPSEGGRVTVDPRPLIAPEPPERIADGVGRAAANGFSDRFHGRPPIGLQDRDRRALPVGVRDVALRVPMFLFESIATDSKVRSLARANTLRSACSLKPN